MLPVLERVSGAIVMGIVLLDVFLTVLYARIGTGLIAERAAHLVWAVFRSAAEAAGSRRGTVLTFCGPAIPLLYVLLWAGGLTLGAGLIIHPSLGRDETAAQAYLDLRAQWSPHIARLAPAMTNRSKDIEAHGSEAP